MDAERYWDRAGAAELWAGIFAGPLAWALDLGISYATVQWSCSMRTKAVLFLFSLLAASLALGGAYLAWRCFARLRQANSEGGRGIDRSRFMALFGMIFGVFFFLVIVAAAIPRVVLSPCD